MSNEEDEKAPDLSTSRSLNEEEDTTERSAASTPEEASWDSSEKSASVQKYEEEWAQIYERDDPELGELRRRAVLGNLRASRFRSVCWRVLLGVFSPDTSLWLSQLQQERTHYSQILKELCIDPWDCSQPEDNPLSQNAESIWHQYFCDKELRAVIRQDVVRTFPGVDFFRKEQIQDAMVNILFCYARENPAMCYRQGMHEILAPLLFVLHCDHQALLHTREQVTVNDVIVEVLDPAFLEEDAYTLFCRIMSGIESCYRINDLTPTPTGYFPANLHSPQGNGKGGGSTENEVVAQLNWIRDNLLAPHDPQLYEHLQQLDIPLPLFGIRWLRLLFGREFPLQDLLVLWDAIFAEGQNFELVNYIVVAMLIAIRYQLLAGDYTTCMTYLMRYPGAVDITFIIEHALFLKDPQRHCLPAMTSFPNLPVVTVGGRNDLNRAGIPPQPEKETSRKPHQLSRTLSGRFKKLSTRPDRWLGSKPNTNSVGVKTEIDRSIVEGYTLDDPGLLKAEMQHAHAVMSLCRLKLSQYHGVLHRSVHPTGNQEALQALDGIREEPQDATASHASTGLHFLNLYIKYNKINSHLIANARNLVPPQLNKHSVKHHTEVEPAYEAGETKTLDGGKQQQQVLTVPIIHPEKPKHKQEQQSSPPLKTDFDMEVFSKTEGGTVQGAPSSDPLGHRPLYN